MQRRDERHDRAYVVTGMSTCDPEARQALCGIIEEARRLRQAPPRGALRAWADLDGQLILYALWRMQARAPALSLAYTAGRAGGEPCADTRLAHGESRISLRGTKEGWIGAPPGFPEWMRHDFAWTLMLRWTVLLHELGHVLLTRLYLPLRLPRGTVSRRLRRRLNEHLFDCDGRPACWSGMLYHEIFADLIAAGCLLDLAKVLDGEPFGRREARRFLDMLERARRAAQRARQWDATSTATLTMQWAHESGDALHVLRTGGMRLRMPRLRQDAAEVASRAWLLRMQSPVTQANGRQAPCARLHDLHGELDPGTGRRRESWHCSDLRMLAWADIDPLPKRLRGG